MVSESPSRRTSSLSQHCYLIIIYLASYCYPRIVSETKMVRYTLSKYSIIANLNVNSRSFKMVSEKDRLEAASIKAEANKAFQGIFFFFYIRNVLSLFPIENNIVKAAELYTLAIEHNPNDPTLFCNRKYFSVVFANSIKRH